MSAKAILVFCAQALFVQSAMSQCIGAGVAAPLAIDRLAGWGIDGLRAPVAYDGLAGWAGRGLAYNGLATSMAYDGLTGLGRGLAYNDIYPEVAPAIEITPTSGGALPVTSVSGEAPIGLRVISANVYQGDLEMAGEVPFVGTAGFEGLDLPTAGAGAVNHACGNGDNSMVSDDAVFAPEYIGAAIAPAAAFAPAIGPYGAIAPAAAIAPGLGCRAGWAGTRIAL